MKNTLKQLSDRASEGEWGVFDQSKTLEIGHAGKLGHRPCIVGWQGFDSTDKSLPECRANAQFIVALVNAYRAGELVSSRPEAGAKREWPHGEATLAGSTPLPTYDEDAHGRSGGLLLYSHVYEARWAALKTGEYCLQWNRLPAEVKEMWERLAGNVATETRRSPLATKKDG